MAVRCESQGWLTTVTRRACGRGLGNLRRFPDFAGCLSCYGLGRSAAAMPFLDETNTVVFFGNPGAAIIHASILQYAPVNTDVLPTFVLPHLAFSSCAVAHDPQRRGRTDRIASCSISWCRNSSWQVPALAERRNCTSIRWHGQVPVRVRRLVCI